MLSKYIDLMSIALKESYVIRIFFVAIATYLYFYFKGAKNYDN
jgi:hypothetical protein